MTRDSTLLAAHNFPTESYSTVVFERPFGRTISYLLWMIRHASPWRSFASSGDRSYRDRNETGDPRRTTNPDTSML